LESKTLALGVFCIKPPKLKRWTPEITAKAEARGQIMTILLDNERDNELCEKARRLGEHTTQAEMIHKA
jgi:hypothetical protein